MIRVSALILAAFLTTACSLFGDKEEPIEPPAELVAFEATVKVDRLWNVRFGKGAEGLLQGLTPATEGGRVYAGTHNGRAISLDVETGKPVWAVSTKLEFSAGPGVGEGLVVFGTSEGEVLALDIANGQERWRTSVSGEVLASPVVGQNTVIVRSVDGHLRALSAYDGGELWDVEQPVPRLTLRGNGTPAIIEDIVVAGFDNGRLVAYDLNDGDTRWENVVAPSRGRTELERLADVDSSIHVVGPDLYTASYSGRVASLAIESGRILWSQDVSSYKAIGADWTNIYITDKNGEVVAVNRSSGAIQWSQPSMRMRSLTPPIPFAATIVVGDFEGYLHWLDARSGQLVARSQAGKSAIVGTPVVAGDAIIVQTDKGHLVAYRLKEPAT